MRENVLNLVRENAGDAIIDNPAIPNEYNEAAVQTTAQSIISGLRQQVNEGNLEGFMNLFSGKAGTGTNHSVINHVNQCVVSNLMTRFDISNGAAGAIASAIVPTVMEALISKTSDPNDASLTLPGMLSSLLSEDSSGLLNQALERFNLAKKVDSPL